MLYIIVVLAIAFVVIPLFVALKQNFGGVNKDLPEEKPLMDSPAGKVSVPVASRSKVSVPVSSQSVERVYPGTIMVRGKPFPLWVGEIQRLKKQKRHPEAIELLMEIVEVVEKDPDLTDGAGLPPHYYRELAIIYRKDNNKEKEIEILKRYISVVLRYNDFEDIEDWDLVQRLNKILEKDKRKEEVKFINETMEHNKEWAFAVSVNGKHYGEWSEKIKELKKENRNQEAIDLLLLCVEASEREQEMKGGDFGVMPSLYKDLAVLYRKEKKKEKEIEILKRFKSRMEGKNTKYKQTITNELFERLDSMLQKL